MESKCQELWDLVSSKVQNKASQSTKISGMWLHLAINSVQLQQKRRKDRTEEKGETTWRHRVTSRVLWASSATVLLGCCCCFFLNRHQLSSPWQRPQRLPGWRRPLRVDAGDSSSNIHTKTGEAPEDETVVVRLRWHARCKEMSERSTGSGRDHLSATAAAMGTRIVPRAVAANSSISVFNRLMTHSMASRPWDRQERIFFTAVKGQLASSGAAHVGSTNPSQSRRDLQYLVGVDRDGFCHQTLQIAAKTDTLHTDEGLLSQHCPEGTQMSQDYVQSLQTAS